VAEISQPKLSSSHSRNENSAMKKGRPEAALSKIRNPEARLALGELGQKRD
jgi:hypothetical protein